MTKRFFCALMAMLMGSQVLAAKPGPSVNSSLWPEPSGLVSPSYMLIDLSTGQSLSSRKEDLEVAPAGLTSLMTAYITLSAIRDRTLRLNQALPTPAESEIPPGPRMFLGADGAKVQELLRGLMVVGAQDAALALAKGVSGDEASFVLLMNQAAARLGMTKTRFVNATGAASSEARTTARDMALLAASLFREFPEAFELSRQRSLQFNGILQTNKNRLLWLDQSVDGLFATDLTGGSSGLVTARRPQPIGPREQIQRRLLVVLLQAPSPEVRSQETLRLLNFGYQQFDLVRLFRSDERPTPLPVFKGGQDSVRAEFKQDVQVAVPRGAVEQLRLELQRPRGLVAPVTAGQPVGLLRVWLGNLEIHRVEMTAVESVKPAGLLGRSIDSARLLFQSLQQP
ncbi:MAG: D-alanyl-D-alanine carboxypeptidase [Betaproteobacteria bacterium]|nr:D-alanyl-D-alanine carboxypeptidase [Betaproteobacteria bacterium]NBT74970.1 D-alanyl-D-alanine carboxypeptidase [Betaproteobacteria bacterium]NCA15701.1 D-alanyl-D-alanine carboxypeptidase [Betaproteobacteria bacterium]